MKESRKKKKKSLSFSRPQEPQTPFCFSGTPDFLSTLLFYYAKGFDCMDHNKLWKILKEMGYQTTLPACCKTCMQVKKQQLEPDIEQQIGSKSGKEYIKAVYYHPAYLNYKQSTSCEMLGWMKHKLESRLLEEISIASDMQMTPPLWQESEELRNLLVKVKDEGEKLA